MQSPQRRRKLERLAREAAGLPKDLAAQIGLDDDERAWRDLGEALDSLVRSVENRDRLSEGLARRVHGLWNMLPDPRLEAKATELVLGRHQVLAADAKRGRWILPAYMAGLRRIAPHRGAAPEDVARLAVELARLGPEDDAIARFAEWLACDGGKGFVITTYPPFAALGRALYTRSLLEDTRLEAVSQRAVDGWNGRHWVASRRLAEAASEARFQQPAAAYLRAAQQGALDMTSEEVTELRDACNELAYWSRVETQTVLEDASLGAAFTPQRLSARLETLIATSTTVDNGLLSFLAELGERDVDGAAVLRALDVASIGEHLAARLELTQVDPALVVDVLATLGRASSTGTMRGLLQRAGDDLDAQALLVEMLRTRGAVAMLEYVESLRESALIGRFYAAALAAGEPVARVRARLDGMVASSKAAVLAAAPRLAMQVPAAAARALVEAPRDAAPLVDMLAQQGRAGAEILRQSLEAPGRRSWPPQVRKCAMDALVAEGFGRAALLPLVQSRDAGLSSRLAAIDALCAVPRLRAELSRWRPSAREPRELRERIAQIQWDEGEG